MKHTTKTKIFKALSVFPNVIGFGLYYFMQNIGSKATLGYKIKSTASSFEVVKRILEQVNYNVESKNILEIGSGWVPVLPYLLILEGKANSVATYDVNEYYNSKEINELNSHFSEKFELKLEKHKKYTLLKGVSYFPKTNIMSAKLRDIDLVLSRFVLEHVTPEDLRSMHNYLFDNLKSGSMVLHLISPSDHRAYTDNSLSLQDFLKYNQEEWNQIQTKFDYHNRLRLPQYLKILGERFEVLYFEHDSIDFTSESYKKFKKINVHEDYSQFSDQELMAGSINILLIKT